MCLYLKDLLPSKKPLKFAGIALQADPVAVPGSRDTEHGNAIEQFGMQDFGILYECIGRFITLMQRPLSKYSKQTEQQAAVCLQSHRLGFKTQLLLLDSRIV